ncbi:MAG: peptide-methionine (S)-S-oxide reductase MsrA [Opitutales bacterium]
MPQAFRLLPVLLASLCLTAAPANEAKPDMKDQPKLEKAMFGAGCFWGVEYQYEKIPGVVDAVSGYAGGHVLNPGYREVCEGDTGHAEVIQVVFDPAKVSYRTLVEYFFRMHDPTQVNRQGPDHGEQYRSVIFAYSEAQRKVAEEVKAALEKSKAFRAPIATRIEGEKVFWKAEEYHQDYYARKGTKPYCHTVPFAPEKK